MDAKIFSYKVDGVLLVPVNDQLQVSKAFDRKGILDGLKESFKAENYKIDEQSVNYKIRDGQLYIEGVVVEIQEYKSFGFMSSREAR